MAGGGRCARYWRPRMKGLPRAGQTGGRAPGVMMALMSGSIVDGVSDPAVRVAELVDGYARRVHPAVLEQHGGGSVCSPLGVWLLLAACATGAQGDDREALELALGCSAEEAGELLALVMADPPPALKAAIAVWVGAADASADLAAWVRGGSGVGAVGVDAVPEAHACADEHTGGLIRRFPTAIESDGSASRSVSMRENRGAISASTTAPRVTRWRSRRARRGGRRGGPARWRRRGRAARRG